MNNYLRHRLSFRSALGVFTALLLGNITAYAQNAIGPEPVVEDEEDVRRYAVEIILFTYADSVSAGTEVFLPDLPEGVERRDLLTQRASAGELENPQTDGDVPYYGDRPRRAGGTEIDFDGNPIDRSTESDADVPELGHTRTRAGYATGNPFADDAHDSIVDTTSTATDELTDAATNDTVDDAETELAEIVAGGANIDFKRLPADALDMSDIHENLERLDAYQPVLWGGWTQIVRDESLSPTLHLRRLGNVPLDVDGTLKLYVGRFVHLEVDVALEARQVRAPSDDDDSQPGYENMPVYSDESPSSFGRYGDPFDRRTPLPVVYRLQQDSIVRNGETRYFDHPKFGLIARLALVENDPDAEFDDDGEGLLPDLLPAGLNDEDAPEPQSR